MLLQVVAMSEGVSIMSHWPWHMISGAVGFAVLVPVFGGNVIRPWWQHHKDKVRLKILDEPCNVFFRIPPRNEIELDYVEQDEKIHLVKELVAPIDSSITFEIVIRPKVCFRESEFILGFANEEIDNRPEILEYFARFVKQDKSRVDSPETNPDHYIDYKDRYHIRRADRATYAHRPPDCRQEPE